jgi:hypothetical protein
MGTEGQLYTFSHHPSTVNTSLSKIVCMLTGVVHVGKGYSGHTERRMEGPLSLKKKINKGLRQVTW